MAVLRSFVTSCKLANVDHVSRGLFKTLSPESERTRSSTRLQADPFVSFARPAVTSGHVTNYYRSVHGHKLVIVAYTGRNWLGLDTRRADLWRGALGTAPGTNRTR